ncbi:lactase/phlorizin hydrolase-like isoform X3 [Syngnathoides biaculeatus]|uniref:lactase/phlorizin hydrolase-like isoform X3 n=1 Tax=Syngnathoides biaculeatus TaxID=300417 RepID=UPI002ADE236C|nr:lactase/phlorizin hydrolase-like isoform X3 [Syngnathoides biaculeatus]
MALQKPCPSSNKYQFLFWVGRCPAFPYALRTLRSSGGGPCGNNSWKVMRKVFVVRRRPWSSIERGKANDGVWRRTWAEVKCLPSQPQRTVLSCYHTLLNQILNAGLQPLVVLHGSTVPEALRSKFGGWESQELQRMFILYAEFALQEFGEFTRSWVILSHLDEVWREGPPHDDGYQQAILLLIQNIYQLYHGGFGDKGKVSVGFRASDIELLLQIQESLTMDFLSVQFESNCVSTFHLIEELTWLQIFSKDVPILIYKMALCDCVDSRLQACHNFLKVLNSNNMKIEGCDMMDILSKMDMEGLSTSSGVFKYSSEKTNSYQTVWDKFGVQLESERDIFLNKPFPSDFQWATSSESFKVEGGWAEGGKGETIWDRFGHENKVYDNQTADQACDSYHKVDYDVYLLRGLQVYTHQFSISWARIFPSGYRRSQSDKGVLYYDELINALVNSRIQPVITLYHWDLPQELQNQGGWTNASIIEAFKDYADFCFSKFGDRVKTWNTFSSPWVVSHAGYGVGDHPPQVQDYVVASYQVTHNIIKSHAEAWHVYNDKYRTKHGGKVGIALNSDWAEPLDPSRPEDVVAAYRSIQFTLGWFAHPIFVDGDYPATLKSQIDKKNKLCPHSKPAILPRFTPKESQRINGTADFFGLNHYTSRLINSSDGGCTVGPQGVGDFQTHVDPSWSPTASEWIYSTPWGLRRLLNYIALEYLNIKKVPVYITGNGMPTDFGGTPLNDTTRVDYLRRYINEALKARLLDGVDVQRFTVQSLLDGFEGQQGYSQRFGLHHVNFEDPDRPRTPKQSAYFYSQVITQNGFGIRRGHVFKVAQTQFKPPSKGLTPSEVPSKSKVVWERFSQQSKFHRQIFHYGTFPSNFTWGVSSSAYQTEGAWKADGKGPSIWDVFTHKPGSIPGNANGDVACDSYHRFQEDLYMLRALQVKSYRFSLSWSRIFPTGLRSSLNLKGVDFYNSIIDDILLNGITPMVTLYYWDLPQELQNIGGWESSDMIEIFADFSDFCFSTFGDRVKFWMTFNQPHTIAWSGYGLGQIPPNVRKPGSAPYRVAHNLIKAHAKAYHIYNEKYRKSQRGLISLALDSYWVEPKDVRVLREVAAADRAMQFHLGWFAHPIFKNGDYPDAMKWQVGNKSELQGLAESRLPVFTEEERKYISGTSDVFCLNHFTTKIVSHITARLTPPSYEYDRDLTEEEDANSPSTAIKNQRAVAWGLRRLLNWVKYEYGDPDIYITDSGVATESKTKWDDSARVFYFKTYIDEALKASNLDDVKVKGFTAASLMDSFEWLHGFKVGFGLHHVNFEDSTRPRTPKYSAHFYHRVIKDNGFPTPEDEKILYGNFAKDFIWSTATASYQIEGGWRADGKGLSIWDKFAHTPLRVFNNDNGDVACDSYNKIDEDVSMLRQLKVTHYRFSVSWPRVLPDGTTNFVNEVGLSYYSHLVDALLKANIQPHITLYHWDLPQALQDIGGWENETIVFKFRDYANLIFSRLGHKVKFWITINEPYNIANVGHGYGAAAPGISFRPGTLPYIVGHNLLKAHAETWHLYNDKYRSKQGGIISITINSDWSEPRNPYKQEDVDAARRVVQFYIGWFAHPVFNGDYSDMMKTIIQKRSLEAGLPKSRLPEFTAEEVKRIKGTYDYFGFNHYTTVLAFPVDYGNLQHYDADRGAGTIADRTWLDSGSSWLKVSPFGFRRILNFIKEEYRNPPIIITENGISERGSVDLNDFHRSYYYEKYINQVLKAYILDGVDIRGYTAWSLMDNLEWATGFSERFGLFHVNHTDPKRPRVAKTSAAYYATIITCNGFPDPATGPHDCLNQEVEGTSVPSTSLPSFNMVNFLGITLSSGAARHRQGEEDDSRWFLRTKIKDNRHVAQHVLV